MGFSSKKINVTKTFLPPISDFHNQLNTIWESHWLTNRGQLVEELEHKLLNYFNVTNVTAMTNGTIPLQIAIKLLGKGGEIITTPFSYIATSSAIVWENCTPVFVDIEEDYFTINEKKIKEAISLKTTAILATHVFGNPCNVEAIDTIAKEHSLKVIYDGAHCFGVKYKGKSIFQYGDISTCSFHATKLFHTGEGGALFANNESLRDKVFYSHNFGHDGYLNYSGVGINGKMSELQAAMGLANFSYIDLILKERSKLVDYYNKLLSFKNFLPIKIRNKTEWNYSYYPIVFKNEELLVETQKELNKSQVYPRRYFYPSLNTVKYLKGDSMKVSESVASRILCLPLYVGLKLYEIDKISSIINKSVC